MRSTLLLYGCVALSLASCEESQPAPATTPANVAKAERAAQPDAAAKPSGSVESAVQPSEHAEVAAGAGEAKPQSDAEPTEEAEDPSTLEVAAPGKAFGQVLIQTSAEDVFAAELTIVRDEGVKAREGKFSYTAEPAVIVATPEVTVSEANMLGSGLAVDLDDDGKTTSKIKTDCDAGVVVLKTKPPTRIEAVTEFTDDVVRFAYGDKGSRLASTRSAGAVLYSPCDKGLTFGLDPKKPIALQEAVSPSVFMVYRRKVEAAADPDPFKLESIKSGEDDVPFTVHSFREYDLTKGDTPEIFAANLVVFAIDPHAMMQHLTVKISGERPDFITASINEVDAQGQRIRYADGFKRF